LKLIVQPNRCSCGLVSLAMLLDESLDNLILEIGHDGTEKVWPHLPEPLCYKGFHTQELLDVALTRGYALVQIDASPWGLSIESEKPNRIFTDEQEDSRMILHMEGVQGILIGEVEGGARHACAWDGKLVYDPRGHIYNVDTNEVIESQGGREFYPIAIDQFLALYRIIGQL
jgi:hypothetical protein